MVLKCMFSKNICLFVVFGFIGLRPVIIRSEQEVDVNKWTSISVGRRHGEGFLKVGDAPQVTGKTAGPARSMYLRTNLYVGGYDKRILLNKGVEVSRGLDGCVSGVSKHISY